VCPHERVTGSSKLSRQTAHCGCSFISEVSSVATSSSKWNAVLHQAGHVGCGSDTEWRISERGGGGGQHRPTYQYVAL
jgi:hypothetical protein